MLYKLYKHMPKACDICKSPLRPYIETMINKRVPQRKIATKWQEFFKCGLDTLRSKISRHKNKHAGLFRQYFIPQSPTMTPKAQKALAQTLIKLGAWKPTVGQSDENKFMF